MSAPADGFVPPPTAAQPFTFGGVAAFANPRLGRLMLIELLVAVVFGTTLVWFVQRRYFPVIVQAIQRMPETARLEQGRLEGVPQTLICESKFLAIAVTPDAALDIGQGADLQFQLRQTDFCVNSVYRPDWGWEIEYGGGATLNLRRSILEPWWGAWQPVIVAGVGAGVALMLPMVWAVLATIYVAPVKILAWFADRSLSWTGAWRLASAALMPGALVLAADVALYGTQAIDLVGLSFFFIAHLVIGWVYLVGGVCATPRFHLKEANRNPFVP
ncbi:MAG: hypothetical protein ABSG59_20335 [Verrucomicrobiota bacterium]|jgi:hypothetical protein